MNNYTTLYNTIYEKLRRNNTILDKLTKIIINNISSFGTNIYKYTDPIYNDKCIEIYFNNYNDFIKHILGNEWYTKHNILTLKRINSDNILYDVNNQPCNYWYDRHKYSLSEWCNVMDIKLNDKGSYTLSDFQIEQYVRYYFG